MIGSKITIKLTRDAYATSGALRLPTEDGKPSIYVLEGERYQAEAADSDGNEYLVTWDIRPEWQAWADEQQSAGCLVDEGDACDWEHPANIIRLEPWTDVTGKATIEL